MSGNEIAITVFSVIATGAVAFALAISRWAKVRHRKS
jgi:hypothetical protein